MSFVTTSVIAGVLAVGDDIVIAERRRRVRAIQKETYALRFFLDVVEADGTVTEDSWRPVFAFDRPFDRIVEDI